MDILFQAPDRRLHGFTQAIHASRFSRGLQHVARSGTVLG